MKSRAKYSPAFVFHHIKNQQTMELAVIKKGEFVSKLRTAAGQQFVLSQRDSKAPIDKTDIIVLSVDEGVRFAIEILKSLDLLHSQQLMLVRNSDFLI